MVTTNPLIDKGEVCPLGGLVNYHSVPGDEGYPAPLEVEVCQHVERGAISLEEWHVGIQPTVFATHT